MPDQVPVNPADGAVVSAVGAPDNVSPRHQLQLTLPTATTCKMSTTMQFLRPRPLLKMLVFFLSLYSFSSRVIRAGRYLGSFSFLSFFFFRLFHVCDKFYFRVCVTNSVFASA